MYRFGMVLYVLASIAAVAFGAAAVFGPAWIEELTGFHPDGGDGSLEALLVAAPAAAAAVLGVAGFAVRRRTAPASS